MWVFKLTYCFDYESGKSAFCSSILPCFHLFRFWKMHFYSCIHVGFHHVQCVALLFLPFRRCKWFFFISKVEKTHLAQSNMSQYILYIPLSSQYSSWFLTALIPSVSHRGEHEGKWFLNIRLFGDRGKDCELTLHFAFSVFALIFLYSFQIRESYTWRTN